MYRVTPGSDPYRKQPPEGAVFKLPWRSGSISSASFDATSVTSHEPTRITTRETEVSHDLEVLPSHVHMDFSEEEVQPKLTVPLALGLMLGVTVITGYAGLCRLIVSRTLLTHLFLA